MDHWAGVHQFRATYTPARLAFDTKKSCTLIRELYVRVLNPHLQNWFQLGSNDLRRGTFGLEPTPTMIWFQLGSNEGPLNRRFFGISGADSTVLKFVNSRMLYR